MQQLDHMEGKTGVVGGSGKYNNRQKNSPMHIQSGSATKFKKRNTAEDLAKRLQSEYSDGPSSSSGINSYGPDGSNVTHLSSSNKKGLDLSKGKQHTHVKSGFGQQNNPLDQEGSP